MVDIIIWVLLGALAGWLGGRIFGSGSGGFLVNLIVGILGSVLGGWIAELLGITVGGQFGQFVVAVIGAVLLLFIVSKVTKK